MDTNTISNIPNTASENNSSEFSPITKYSDIVKSSNGHLNDDCNISENVILSDHDSEWCTVTSKRKNRVFYPINTSDKTSVCHHEPYQQKQLPQQIVPTDEKFNATSLVNRNGQNRQQKQINIDGKNYNQEHGSFKRNNKFITGTSNKNTLSTVEKIDFLFVSRLNPSTECDDVLVYLNEYKTADFKIEKLTPKYTEYSSFKVGIPASLTSVIYTADFWPAGAYVSKFKFPRKPLNLEKPTTIDPTYKHINIDGLNLFYWNTQSITNKLDYISVLINDVNADVICVVEHWLSSQELSVVNIPGYYSARLLNKLASMCNSNILQDLGIGLVLEQRRMESQASRSSIHLSKESERRMELLGFMFKYLHFTFIGPSQETRDTKWKKVLYNLIQLVMLFFYIPNFLGIALGLYKFRENVADMTDIFVIGVSYVTSFPCALYLIKNWDEIKNLMVSMERRSCFTNPFVHSNCNLLSIIEERKRKCKFLTKAFVMTVFIAYFTFVLKAFILDYLEDPNINSTDEEHIMKQWKKMILVVWFPLDPRNPVIFYSIYAYQVLTVFTFFCHSSAVMNFNVVLIQYSSLQFTLTSKAISEIHNQTICSTLESETYSETMEQADTKSNKFCQPNEQFAFTPVCYVSLNAVNNSGSIIIPACNAASGVRVSRQTYTGDLGQSVSMPENQPCVSHSVGHTVQFTVESVYYRVYQH
ncbi:hypothetical protein C0J52_08747 [Blattella germanica]|nr:hypothetical protein C0J52_08747 [Blattella germanica]